MKKVGKEDEDMDGRDEDSWGRPEEERSERNEVDKYSWERGEIVEEGDEESQEKIWRNLMRGMEMKMSKNRYEDS